MAEFAALQAQVDKLREQLQEKDQKADSLKHYTFRGSSDEDSNLFLNRFENRMTVLGISPKKYHVHLPEHLDLQAYSYYRGLAAEVQSDYKEIVAALKERFANDSVAWLHDLKLNTIRQQPNQSVESYNTAFTSLHDLSGFEDDNRSVACYIRGLHPHLQLEVYRQRPDSLNDAMLSARIAEMARNSCTEKIPLVSAVATPSENSPEVIRSISSILETVVNQLDNLTNRVNRSSSRERSLDRNNSPPRRSHERQDYRRSAYTTPADRRPDNFSSRRYEDRRDFRPRFDQSPRRPAQSPGRYNYGQANRGRYDRNVQNEPICYRCSRPGHFARNCMASQERPQPISNQQRVRFARLPPNA